jgi:hypothetical protein
MHSKSHVLANLLAPSRISNQAHASLKTLSRRHSEPTENQEQDEDEDEEEDSNNNRPTKKLDLGRFAFTGSK